MTARLLALVFLVLAPSARAEKPLATLRILSQNIYGRKEADCVKRYEALGKAIAAASPAYDVVALQEHWKIKYDRWFTCDADVLTKALTAAGYTHAIKHKPAATDALEASGGISVFSKLPIVDAQDFKVVNGSPMPLSGSLLVRLEAAKGVKVDLWDVHLEAGVDGCDDDCRWEQATDLGSVAALFDEKNPVLMLGDFNTGGPMTAKDKPPFAGNGKHAEVMEALGSPRDLWLELASGGTDPGFTYDCQMNAVQTCKGRERIDYALLPAAPKASYELIPQKVEVVRFKTDKGTYVSDHFGLDVTLELRQKPTPAAKTLKPLEARLETATERPVSWDGRATKL